MLLIRPRRLLLAGLAGVVALSASLSAAPPAGAAAGTAAPAASAPGSAGIRMVRHRDEAAYRQTKARLAARTPRAATSGSAPAPRTFASCPAAGSLTLTRCFAGNSLGAQVNAFGSGQAATPPDIAVAAGPDSPAGAAVVVEMNNSSGWAWSKADGTPVWDTDLKNLFRIPAGYVLTDPRVTYDAASQRWFASMLAYRTTSTSAASLEYLAVTCNQDPSQGWQPYVVWSSQNTLGDQPRLGVSGNKVALSWDNYYQGSSFSGEGGVVVDKAEAVAAACPSGPQAGPAWKPGPSDWTLLGGASPSRPAIAKVSLTDVAAFVRGTDNHLWWNSYTGGAWSGWVSLGGTTYAAPAAVSWGGGRLDLFIRGTDNRLWHRWYSGGWHSWESLGGTLTSAPTVSAQPNRLDVFARGAAGQLVHKWWYGSGWSGWESLGGTLVGGPGAVSWSPNRIDVVVRGTDNHAYHKWWDGTAWRGYENLGGGLADEPQAASLGVGELDIVVLAPDHQLWRRSLRGSWGGWVPMGFTAGNTAGVVARGSAVDLSTRTSDNRLWALLGSPYRLNFGDSSGNTFGLVPARDVAANDLYAVSNNDDGCAGPQAPQPHTLSLWHWTGSVDAGTVVIGKSAPKFSGTGCPPNAPDGGGHTIDTGDDRVLTVNQSGSNLWASMEDTGLGVACPRLVELTTSGTVVSGEDFRYCVGGEYFYYAAPEFESGGGMIAVLTQSDTVTFPKAVVLGQPSGQPGAANVVAQDLAAGVAAYADGRWGDYSGAAQDPTTGSVWVAGEYVAGSANDWGTYIADAENTPPPPGP